MQKPFAYALLLAAALGLAACDKKEEANTQAPAAPATEAEPSAPAPETTMPEPSEPAPVAPIVPEEQPEEGQ